MLRYTFFVLFIFIFTLKYVDAENMTLVLEVGPKRLYAFDGIGDQTLFHWPAQFSNNNFFVQVSGTVNQSGSGISVKCEPLNVTFLIRKNAIPLPNPRNAFIPENTFVLNDGYVYNGSFILSPDTQNLNTDVNLSAESVTATNFFISLFLPPVLERFEVSGLSKECRYYSTVKVYALDGQAETSNANDFELGETQLYRHQNSLFNVQYFPQSYNFNLTTQNNLVVNWNVFPMTDSGGTLNIALRAFPFTSSSSLSNDIVNTTINGCITSPASTQANNSNCIGTKIELNSQKTETSLVWHFPFPVSGMWTLNLTLQCADLNPSSSACADGTLFGQVNVSISSCVDGCNSDLKHGSCGIYRSDAVLFSACRCKVDWIGLACNDGRNALSFSTQMLHTLLLTLSNLMFVPCVILAIYRQFYSEALIYFFVLFMSSFYHACDQPGQAVYCLLPYETLQFSDFLSSITAIWFTLIAVAKLSIELEMFLQVLGLIAFAVCVSFDRFNVWTTVVPAVVGVLIVVSKWSFKCHESKVCYPGLKKTLFSIVPGIICAGVGLSLYAFLETGENYYIVHSVWHILMASAVLFLLPLGPKQKKSKADLLTNNGGVYSSRNALHYDVHNTELTL